MKPITFENIQELESLANYKPQKVGELFLFGRNMIDQKINKEVGDDISYFVVEAVKSNGNFTYRQVFDKLD